MKQSTRKLLLVVALLLVAIFAISACNFSNDPDGSKNTFTVTFDTQGGSAVASVTVEEGKTLVLPAAPTKTGYIFVGWYLDSDCTQEFSATQTISQNITLYAKWEAEKEKFAVTFVGGEGASGTMQSLQKSEGDTFSLPQNQFVFDGHDFVGWSDGTNIYQVNDSYTMPTHAVQFTAQWKESLRYTVSFNGNDAIGDAPVVSDKYCGEKFNLPQNPYTKTDYIFVGWSDGKEVYAANDEYVMSQGDVTFTAVWEFNKYIVTFDSRGGSEVASIKVEKNSKLTAPAQPKRPGYLFAGWYKNEDCTSLWDFDNDKVTSDITLYANWRPDAVGISSVEGATIDGTAIFMVVDKDVEFVELAEKVILTNNNAYWNLYYDRLGQTKIPTKIAANRDSGTLDVEENVFYILVTSADGLQEKLYTLTIYRRFTVSVNYYDKDGALLVDEEDSTLTSFTMDTYNTIETAYDGYCPVGYQFDYWETIVNDERTKFEFGENGTNVLGPIKLYAHVTPLQYTVTFALEDDETLEESSAVVTYDAAYTLPVPQKTGYTFVAWQYYDSENYTHVCLTDGEGNSLENWTFTKDLELVAKWSLSYYDVTVWQNIDGAGYVSGGGSTGYGRTCYIYATTYIGYDFVGWYEGETLLTEESTYSFVMETQPRNFVANWKVQNEYASFNFTSNHYRATNNHRC